MAAIVNKKWMLFDGVEDSLQLHCVTLFEQGVMATKPAISRKRNSTAVTKLHKASQDNSTLLNQYCKDIQEWPDSWSFSRQDIPIGNKILEQLIFFLLDRIHKGRAKRTIKIYATYLWALGGELIREINYYDEERKLSAKQLILKYVDDSGGPLWRHARDEHDHDRYDSVCRGLYKFLTKSP